MKHYLRRFFGLPLAVKWFLATEILYGFGFALWNLNYNFHLSARQFSAPQIGAVNGFGLVVTALFSLVAGKWCDRYGFRPGIVLGCLVRACGILTVAIVPGREFIYLGQMLFSIGTAFIMASEFPLILSLVADEFNHLVYNMLYGAAYTGIFIGYLSGGFISGPVVGPVTRYALPLFFSGLSYLLIGVARQFLPRQNKTAATPRIFAQILLEPKIIWFSLYGLLGSLAFYLVSSMVNLICRDAFQRSDAAIGIIYTFQAVASGAATFCLPFLLRRSGKTRLGFAGLWLSTLTLLGMAVARYPSFVILWIGFSFFNMLLPGAVDSPMLQAIREDEQGSYSGIRICANHVGYGAGAWLSGLMLGYADYSLNMMAGAGVILAQIVVYGLGCRKYLRFSENIDTPLT